MTSSFKAAAPESACAAEYGISLDHLRIRFDENLLFRNASFSAVPGDIVGLIGPNGAGKSTFLKMLAGLVLPSMGEGMVMGCQLGSSVRVPCGIMLENPPFIDEKSGLENLCLLGRMHGFSADVSRVQATNAMINQGLSPRNRTPVSRYSLGMRKRLGFAQATLGEPRLYLLDEPMNGLDPLALMAFRKEVLHLADNGCIVIMSSHLLDELEKTCTKFYLFYDGSIREINNEAVRLNGLEQTYVDAVRIITR